MYQSNKSGDINNEIIENENVDNFDDMGLSDDILRGIYSYGFERPSSVQQRIIVPFSKGKDVIISPTRSGVGSMSALVIGILERIDYGKRKCQALVLEPSREISYGVSHVFAQLGKFRNVNSIPVVGGVRIADTINAINNGPHVIVGTPGRLYDMIQRGILDPTDIRMVMLQHLDEILSRGFEESLLGIVGLLSLDVQFGIHSCTMPPEAKQLVAKLLRNPVCYSDFNIRWKDS